MTPEQKLEREITRLNAVIELQKIEIEDIKDRYEAKLEQLRAEINRLARVES